MNKENNPLASGIHLQEKRIPGNGNAVLGENESISKNKNKSRKQRKGNQIIQEMQTLQQENFQLRNEKNDLENYKMLMESYNDIKHISSGLLSAEEAESYHNADGNEAAADVGAFLDEADEHEYEHDEDKQKYRHETNQRNVEALLEERQANENQSNSKILHLQKQLCATQQQIHSLQAEIQEKDYNVQEIIQRSKQKLKEEQLIFDRQTKQCLKLETDLQSSQEIISSHNITIEKYKNELDSFEMEKQELLATNEENMNRAMNIEQELRSKNMHIENQMQSLEDNNSRLRLQSEQLLNTCDTLQQRNHEIQQQSYDIENETQKSHEKLRFQISKMEQQIQEQSQEMQEQTQQIYESNANLEDERKEYECLKSENENLLLKMEEIEVQSKEEIERLWTELDEQRMINEKNEKLKEDEYMMHLKTCDYSNVIQVIDDKQTQNKNGNDADATADATIAAVKDVNDVNDVNAVNKDVCDDGNNDNKNNDCNANEVKIDIVIDSPDVEQQNNEIDDAEEKAEDKEEDKEDQEEDVVEEEKAEGIEKEVQAEIDDGGQENDTASSSSPSRSQSLLNIIINKESPEKEDADVDADADADADAQSQQEVQYLYYNNKRLRQEILTAEQKIKELEDKLAAMTAMSKPGLSNQPADEEQGRESEPDLDEKINVEHSTGICVSEIDRDKNDAVQRPESDAAVAVEAVTLAEKKESCCIIL